MLEIEITNKDLYEKLEEIRKLTSTQLCLFRLLNAEAIENARKSILKLEVRRRIFDLCDNRRSAAQIAQDAFPGEPIDKFQPKASYHFAILEECGMISHRDEGSIRYYYKTGE